MGRDQVSSGIYQTSSLSGAPQLHLSLVADKFLGKGWVWSLDFPVVALSNFTSWCSQKAIALSFYEDYCLSGLEFAFVNIVILFVFLSDLFV